MSMCKEHVIFIIGEIQFSNLVENLETYKEFLKIKKYSFVTYILE